MVVGGMVTAKKDKALKKEIVLQAEHRFEV